MSARRVTTVTVASQVRSGVAFEAYLVRVVVGQVVTVTSRVRSSVPGADHQRRRAAGELDAGT